MMNCPHCNTHVDEHLPNACFDKWIAETFGLFEFARYTSDITVAWQLVMHFKDRQYSVVLEGGDAFAWSRWDFSIWSPLDDPDFSDEMAHGWDESKDLNERIASAPLAICRATIKAKLKR